MERAQQFYCHTCAKDFKYAVKSEDEDVSCPLCKDTFVELIEEQTQLEEAKQSVRVTTRKSSNEEFFDCHSEPVTDKNLTKEEVKQQQQ